jgi:uncharacterized protein YraI
MQLKSIMLAAGVLALSAGAAAAATVTNDLNLRSGPGTGYGVITSMPAGAYVDVLDCSGSWCRVDWQGTVGYASASYLAGGGGGGYAVVPPPPVYYGAPATVFSFGFGSGPRYYGHRGSHHYRNNYRQSNRHDRGHYRNRGGNHDGSNYRRGGNHDGSSYRGGGSSRGDSGAVQRAIRNLSGNRNR